MGQQQLILLVLATVIVGLAIVVGIAAFTQGGDNANADAMMQDAVTIANDIQAWAQTPAPFGGPSGDTGDEDFTDADFQKLGYAADVDEDNEIEELIYSNLNGTFTLTQGTDDILITGESFIDGDETETRNEIRVRVCSSRGADQIRGANITIGGQDTGITDAPAC